MASVAGAPRPPSLKPELLSPSPLEAYREIGVRTSAQRGKRGLRLLGPVPANGGGAESQFMAELGESVARRRLGLGDACEIVRDLYKLYSERMGANPGKPFWEVYDLRTLEPSPEWMEAMSKVKKELASGGCSSAGFPLYSLG